ncbi:hypothetical protein XELAEV_18020401mg [Xenopus laevis]|uniref:Uncharacterized protein n=1 Tax=Xenopus laevis TaxID=8355 RepID=A0A974D9M9_XENLA|nr:hypothetical protein XELAEV_18020401mg [Xenopus laevis]
MTEHSRNTSLLQASVWHICAGTIQLWICKTYSQLSPLSPFHIHLFLPRQLHEILLLALVRKRDYKQFQVYLLRF